MSKEFFWLSAEGLVQVLRGNEFALQYSDIFLRALMDAVEKKPLDKKTWDSITSILSLSTIVP